MKKSIFSITVLAFITLFLSSCASEPLSPLQNGSYSVIFDDFDSTGWKAYLVLYVKDQKIENVEYDYIGSSTNGGKMKSEDSSYAEAMYSITGTKPELYIRQLVDSLLTHQDPDQIETVSGATTSTKDFKKFAKLAIEAARKGDTSPITVSQNE
ncbi:FMN-binding protein [Proteiniclasticum sp.]|uniref:FMN-binding protein n=1 Tax=Proteiniclasticum sp. TaxID=2053595 RepID=UPI00289D38CE|nr:FMN-binding protein [Proteiniclasticum sp.]